MTTPNGSPELSTSQASKEVTVNEQVRRTEAGANFYVVVDKDLTAPPGSCADGATYIVGSSPSGAWAGHQGDIAIAVGTNAVNAWYFREQAEGLFAWVQDENLLYYISVGSSPPTWVAYSTALVGSLALNDLSDVDTAGAADNYVLIYDADSPTGFYVRKNTPLESFVVAVTDETTAISTGTAKMTFRMPYAAILSSVKGGLSTAQTSGGQVQVDIKEGGVSILSTKILFDNGSKTSVGSSPQPVISDVALADDAEVTIDIPTVGDGTAKGLKVTFLWRQA